MCRLLIRGDYGNTLRRDSVFNSEDNTRVSGAVTSNSGHKAKMTLSISRLQYPQREKIRTFSYSQGEKHNRKSEILLVAPIHSNTFKGY